MTQLDLAMASGIALGTISRLENGHNYPRKNVRQALADALGIDMDRLFPRPERKAS